MIETWRYVSVYVVAGVTSLCILYVIYELMKHRQHQRDTRKSLDKLRAYSPHLWDNKH